MNYPDDIENDNHDPRSPFYEESHSEEEQDKLDEWRIDQEIAGAEDRFWRREYD